MKLLALILAILCLGSSSIGDITTIVPGTTDRVPPSSLELTLSDLVEDTYEDRIIQYAITCADNRAVKRVEFLVDGVVRAASAGGSLSGEWDTGLGANTVVVVRSRCYDVGNNMIQTANKNVTVDVTAPTATNFFVLAVSGTQLVAKWDASDTGSGLASTADINRCNPSPCTPCPHAVAAVNPYTMTFAAPNLDRRSDWTVQSHDKVGNKSAASNKVTASVSDLVALFKFDNNCTDGSLTGNNCTLNGNAAYTTSSGKNVLTVDGNGDYARAVDHQFYTRRDALTVVASLNCDNRCSTSQFFVSENKVSERTFSFLTGTVAGSLIFQIFRNNVAVSTGSAIGGQIPATGWFQTAGVFNGTLLSIYKDTVLIQAVSSAGTIDEDIVDLVIGASSVPGNYFNGLIGPVYVYNIALTTAQLSYLHSLGVP